MAAAQADVAESQAEVAAGCHSSQLPGGLPTSPAPRAQLEVKEGQENSRFLPY